MYTRFGDNDIVTRQAQELVTSTWSNNVNNLQVGFTSSVQAVFTSPTSSGQFFIEVYDKAVDSAGGHTADATTEVQYAVSYGHKAGTGSNDFTNDTGSFGLGATRVIYNQYRQLHYNDDTQLMTFGTHPPDDFFVININRSRYKQRLTLGSLDLHISGTAFGQTTATNKIIKLTDDSVTNPNGVGTSNLGTYYNIVSGSKGVVSGSATNQLGGSGSFGHFYPEAGLIILNGDMFSGSKGSSGNIIGTGSGGPATNTDRNHQKLFQHITGAGNFIVDTTEEINSQFYFCRVRNDQYNYTNNESFVDNNKNIRFETMKLNPKVFITTVGLYNDTFELMGIAKLSQPIAKDFTKEAMIRVKLDY
tara:strand:- start:2308 stop:3390 length:1083 start_codon:yes stop_codon:yes gene_type:complete